MDENETNKPDDDETIWSIRVKVFFNEKVNQAASSISSTKSDFVKQAVREKLEKMGISPTENGNGKKEGIVDGN